MEMILDDPNGSGTLTQTLHSSQGGPRESHREAKYEMDSVATMAGSKVEGATGQGNGNPSPTAARNCVLSTLRMSSEVRSSLELPERNAALSAPCLPPCEPVNREVSRVKPVVGRTEL